MKQDVSEAPSKAAGPVGNQSGRRMSPGHCVCDSLIVALQSRRNALPSSVLRKTCWTGFRLFCGYVWACMPSSSTFPTPSFAGKMGRRGRSKHKLCRRGWKLLQGQGIRVERGQTHNVNMFEHDNTDDIFTILHPLQR